MSEYKKEFVGSISQNRQVTAYLYGKTLEFSTSLGNQNPPIRLNDEEYMVRVGETYEIRKYKSRSKTRNESLNSVKKTMNRLKRIIGYNFTGGSNQLWITLTYKILMRDTKRVQKDFQRTIRRLRETFGNLEYITALEPQETGSWHLHVLLKSTELETLYISNAEMSEMWEQGFVNVKRIKESDNISAYLMAYLKNYAHSDVSERGTGNTPKSIEKGRRLEFYPSNANIYRRSKGIESPPKITATKEALLTTFGLDDEKSDYYIKQKLRNFEVETEFYTLKEEMGSNDMNKPLVVYKVDDEEMYNRGSAHEAIGVAGNTFDKYFRNNTDKLLQSIKIGNQYVYKGSAINKIIDEYENEGIFLTRAN